MDAERKNSASLIRFPGSKAEPKGSMNLVQLFPSELLAASKYEVARNWLPVQTTEETPLFVRPKPLDVQLTPWSSDQYKAPLASAPTQRVLFRAPWIIVGVAASATTTPFANAGDAGIVMTPAIATTEIVRLDRASFNHWFTSHRVGRTEKIPGISGECVDV